MCQCPERGDLHFYESLFSKSEKDQSMCQCPERGDLHFYGEMEIYEKIRDKEVSMP